MKHQNLTPLLNKVITPLAKMTPLLNRVITTLAKMKQKIEGVSFVL